MHRISLQEFVSQFTSGNAAARELGVQGSFISRNLKQKEQTGADISVIVHHGKPLRVVKEITLWEAS